MANLYTPDENFVDTPDEYPPSNQIYVDRDNVEFSTVNLPDQVYQTLSVDDRTYLYLDEIGAAVPPPNFSGPPRIFSYQTNVRGLILRWWSSPGINAIQINITNGSTFNTNISRNGGGDRDFQQSVNYTIPLGTPGPYTITFNCSTFLYGLTASTTNSLNANPSFINCFELQYLSLISSGLTNIDTSELPLNFLAVQNNQIDSTSGNAILDNIINSGIVNGTLGILNQQSGPITLDPAKVSTLQARGWLIS